MVVIYEDLKKLDLSYKYVKNLLSLKRIVVLSGPFNIIKKRKRERSVPMWTSDFNSDDTLQVTFL